MSDFWKFVVAVFWHWQSWAGGSGAGGAIVVFVAIYERLSGHAMGKRMYVFIFIVVFLVGASFVAWQEQYHAVQAANQQMRAMQKHLDDLTKPNLAVSIDELGIGTGSPGGILKALVTASVANKGAPSIAENWKLFATLKDGSKYGPFQSVFINPNEPIVSHNPDYKIASSDALYNKTMQPITQGDKKRGVLIFVFAGLTLEQARQSGVKYTLSCTDVNGDEFHVDYTWTGVNTPHGYYPGLEPPPK